MVRDGGAWGDLISLSWSVPGIVGDGKRLEDVRNKLAEDGLGSVHKMKQVTARSRALIAIGLSQSPEKGAELLHNFQNYKDWGKWEYAVAESLSVEGSIGPETKTAVDKLSELQIASSSKPVYSLTDKYASTINKRAVEVPEDKQDFKIRPEYRRSDLLRIQESTQQRSPFVSSRKSPDPTMRRPSLKPLSKLPKLDSFHKKESLQRDSVHRKGSFARSNSFKSKLTSASAKRPKMLMEDDNMAMDPDSLGATLIRDAEKKKEKELQAEKRRHEIEERRREREEKKEQEMLKRKSSKLSSRASDGKNDAKEPDGPSKGGRTAKVEDVENDDNDRELKRKASGTRTVAGRTRKLQRNDKLGETTKASTAEAKDENTPDVKDEKTADVQKEAPVEEPSAECAPERDVDQILGPDQNALSTADRRELEQFLNGSKNIFEDGQNKRDFVIHEAKIELDGGDPELSHVVETIVFQASRDWQWRKLKRKRTYKKDGAEDGKKADGD